MASCPRLVFKAIKYGREDVRARRIEARDTNKQFMGAVTVTSWGDGLAPRVTHIEVNEDARKCGIGTKLYEQAAKVSCKTFKQPLHSDIERSRAADGFWQKQVRKGRATCVKPAEYTRDVAILEDGPAQGRSGCYQYALKQCPAPASLAGRRRR